MKTRRILIIEDNQTISNALGEVLTELGYQIDYAVNGKDGLDHLINREPPDLIILDFLMPVLGGCEFRQRQMQIPYLAKIPVVAISADAYIKRKCLPLRIDNFLKKPFELDDLLEVMERCF